MICNEYNGLKKYDVQIKPLHFWYNGLNYIRYLQDLFYPHI